MDKIAISEETTQFTEWVLLKNDKVNTTHAVKFLERQGVDRNLYSSSTGQPLKKGEWVWVDLKKAPGHLQDVLHKHHGNVGEVVDVEGDDVVLKFMGELYEGQNGTKQMGNLRIDGGAVGPKAGLYRYNRGFSAGEKSHLFECVYLKDDNAAPVSQARREAIKEYLEGGGGKENRSSMYYTGMCQGIKTNKQNEDYFTIASQQRPYPVTINPKKGTLLYIGILNKRPSGWKEEYMKIMRGLI